MKNWDINGSNMRILANLRNSNKGPAPQRGSCKRRVCGAWFIKSTKQSVNFLTSVNSFYKTRPPKLDGGSRRWLRPILHAEIFDSSCARLHFICTCFFCFCAISKSSLNTIVKCTTLAWTQRSVQIWEVCNFSIRLNYRSLRFQIERLIRMIFVCKCFDLNLDLHLIFGSISRAAFLLIRSDIVSNVVNGSSLAKYVSW